MVRRTAPILTLFAALAVAAVSVAQPRDLRPVAGPFPAGPRIALDCLLDKVDSAGWYPEPLQLRLLWDRETGDVTFLNPDNDPAGHGSEIEGFEYRDGRQYSAHFGPPPVIDATRFDPRFGTSLLSIRSDGSAVHTMHSIVYGGMRALTQSGDCLPFDSEQEGLPWNP
ncbi:hypothetical protein [Oceaniglobus indicus]|uniref:hypothetical protein n=1 Tax=Oceaniglobus indicus TaxID=2047749 RepID=UPI000C19111A|nr:hypothetical protein [Oceaniglobus indicus]